MALSNSEIKFKGESLVVLGESLKVGAPVPQFKLTATDMSTVASDNFAGEKFIILTVPSLDTPTCAIEAKKFNEKASKSAKILLVSRDLPFAQKRYCAAEGVENLVMASDYKDHSFGKSFGVEIRDWSLHARAVFSVDASGVIQHVEYVEDVSAEPDYEAALSAIA